MPKRNRKPKFGQNMLAQTVQIPFREISETARQVAVGFQFNEVDLNIAAFSSDRIAALAPFYKYWRIRDLKVTHFYDGQPGFAAVTAAGATTGYVNSGMSIGLAFIPAASGTFGAATSYFDLISFPEAKLGPATRPLTLKLGPAQLWGSQPTKWLFTKNTGSISADLLSAGCVTYASYHGVGTPASSSYTTMRVVMEGIIEFKVPIEDSLGAVHHRELPTPPVTYFEEKDADKGISDDTIVVSEPSTPNTLNRALPGLRPPSLARTSSQMVRPARR